MKNLLSRTLLTTFVLTGIAQADPVSLTLPKETTDFKPGPGSEIARSQCLICHSADYVSTQPPGSSRAYWQATVEKMRKTFGAPLPDAQIAPLVDYLVKNYGTEQPPTKAAQ